MLEGLLIAVWCCLRPWGVQNCHEVQGPPSASLGMSAHEGLYRRPSLYEAGVGSVVSAAVGS